MKVSNDNINALGVREWIFSSPIILTKVSHAKIVTNDNKGPSKVHEFLFTMILAIIIALLYMVLESYGFRFSIRWLERYAYA